MYCSLAFKTSIRVKKAITQLIDGLDPAYQVDKLVLEASLLESQLRALNALGLGSGTALPWPEPRENSPYLIVCDLLNAAIEKMADISKKYGLNPRDSAFWKKLDKYTQAKFEKRYELRRRIEPVQMDFVQFCEAIRKENHIFYHGSKLIPGSFEETDDPYYPFSPSPAAELLVVFSAPWWRYKPPSAPQGEKVRWRP